jgi:hypothetical protein
VVDAVLTNPLELTQQPLATIEQGEHPRPRPPKACELSVQAKVMPSAHKTTAPFQIFRTIDAAP